MALVHEVKRALWRALSRGVFVSAFYVQQWVGDIQNEEVFVLVRRLVHLCPWGGYLFDTRVLCLYFWRFLRIQLHKLLVFLRLITARFLKCYSFQDRRISAYAVLIFILNLLIKFRAYSMFSLLTHNIRYLFEWLCIISVDQLFNLYLNCTISEFLSSLQFIMLLKYRKLFL